jgi:hypothetical protein
VRVHQHDRIRAHARKTIPPVEAAVDHHLASPVASEQRAVTPMSVRSHLDLAPRPENAKRQAPLVHEQHVAVRAPRDRLVDRPPEQTLEKAVFAAADDDQIGVAPVGHLEQTLGRIP